MLGVAKEAFGADRLMFGSDWPMSTLTGPYSEILEKTAFSVGDLTDAEAHAFWSGNVERRYSADS